MTAPQPAGDGQPSALRRRLGREPPARGAERGRLRLGSALGSSAARRGALRGDHIDNTKIESASEPPSGRSDARTRSSAVVDDDEIHFGKAGEADRVGSRRREVDHPAAHERAAIVDANHYGTPRIFVGHLHQRAEREGAMCRRQPARGGTLAVGRTSSRVYRSNSGLSCCV